MKQPKPPEDNLTKQGAPRQRAPGGGRKPAGRTNRLSLVSDEGLANIKALAAHRECSQAEAIEYAASMAVKRIERAKLLASARSKRA